jgi:tryptophan 2,3-dioxygenase
MTDRRAALTYSSYLALDEVLAAQRPRTAEHDELLFVVIHQVYELWFKQLLHELRALQRRFEAGDGPHALHTLHRVRSILKTIVAQIDVLETMTPRQFASFRARLESASGFQSAQLRELEALLGRRDRAALRPYPPGGTAHARIAAALERASVFDSFLRYLAAHGYAVPAATLERDVRRELEPSEAVQDVLLAVYRDEAEPAHVCESLIDIDEGLQEWRYHYVKMVQRTIGGEPGPGGSPSPPYFPDLWAIRSRL